MSEFGDVKQLEAVFAKFTDPVRIKVYYDDSELGQGIYEFRQKFGRLTDKLLWDEEKTAGIPGMEIFRHDGSPTGVTYHAVPGGHELQSFVLALYNAAGPGQAVADEVLSGVKALTGRRNIKVMMTLSCTMCPEAVTAAQRLALLSDNISAEIFEVVRFPDIIEKYNIKGVPCIVIDDGHDEHVTFGRKNINEMLALLQAAE